MKHSLGLALIIGAMAVAAAQEKDAPKLLAQNKEKGVEIRAPRSPGKEQMWEAVENKDGFHAGSAVLVRHRVDSFTVEVNVVNKGGSDFMSEDMEQSWPKLSTIGQHAREQFTKGQADKPSDFTECKVVSEDPKAKLGGLPGSGYSHRVLLTDKKGEKRELIEYFVISSDILYRVTVTFTKESYAKHWAPDGQYILHNIRRCKIERK